MVDNTKEKDEFEFEVEQESAPVAQARAPAEKPEIEVEDDTPPEDRGRAPMPKALVEELEADDLEEYSEKVKTRLKQMKKVWHDERREKEAALREQQAAVAYAQRLREENERMKKVLEHGGKQYAETVVNAAAMQLRMAEQAYKDAYESGDSDKVVEANKALQAAQYQAMQAQSMQANTLQRQNYDVQTQHVQQEPVVTAPKPDNKALEWQQRNQWFGQKRAMTAYAFGVHEEL